MGIHDREYMRPSPGPFRPLGAWRALSMTTRLLIVNGALWFVYSGALSAGGRDGGLYRFIHDVLLVHPYEVFGSLRLWQPFTAIWFHEAGGLGHVFFNLLFLWVFGRPTEELVGARSLLRLYVGAGLVSTLAFTVWGLVIRDPSPGIGASGAVYGIGVFLAFCRPRLPLVFLVVRVPLWVVVGIFLVGSEVVNLVVYGRAEGHTIAHLAGAAAGALFYLRLRAGGPSGTEWFRPSGPPQPPPPPTATRPPLDDRDVKARVDALLARIHADGIDALSAEEKDFLEQASRRYGR